MAVYSGSSQALEAQGYRPVYSFRNIDQAIGFGNHLRETGQVRTFKLFDQGLGNGVARFVLFGR